MQFANRAGQGYKKAHSRLFDAGGNANNSHTTDMQTAETEVPRAQKEIKLTPADEARFWSKVDKSGGPDGCWLWKAGLDKHGYGRFGAGGRINLGNNILDSVVDQMIPASSLGGWMTGQTIKNS